MKSNIAESGLVDWRMANEKDRPFIMATWLKGLKFGNSWYRLIDDKIYFKVYHDVIERIITKPGVVVRVACLKEDPDVILGYSVWEADKLHWVQIKKAWRKVGIAKSLVPPTITTVTHLTDVGKSIFLVKRLIFNPFILF